MSRSVAIEEECSLQSFLPFLESNQPVLFRDAITKHWTLSPRVLTSLAGSEMVPVDLPLPAAGTSYGVRNRVQMLYSDFIEKAASGDYNGMYLRDWHVDRLPGVCQHYTVLDAFQDDWLNWYFQRIQPLQMHTNCENAYDDYSFCYVGTAESFTGVHHDVCLSYSWSASISGRKRWYLWAPEHADVLSIPEPITASNSNSDTNPNRSDKTALDMADLIGYHLQSVNTETLVSDPRYGRYDPSMYPHLSDTDKRLTVLQHPGDVIFVPSGWYHFVENLPDNEQLGSSNAHFQCDMSQASAADSSVPEPMSAFTTPSNGDTLPMHATTPMVISINRNWINSFNLYSVVSFIRRDWCAVQLELRHFLPRNEWETTFVCSIDKEKVSDSEKNMSQGDVDANMLMNPHSWYVHCEQILKANCAIDLCMLMEILSARLALLLALNIDSELNEPSLQKHAPCQQSEEKVRIQNPSCKNGHSWQQLFCPHLNFSETYHIDASDMHLARLQKRTLLPGEGSRGSVWDQQWLNLHAVLVLLDTTAGLALALAHNLQHRRDRQLHASMAKNERTEMEHLAEDMNTEENRVRQAIRGMVGAAEMSLRANEGKSGEMSM